MTSTVPAQPREHERCQACGFDGGTYDDAALLEALRALGAQWRELLLEAGESLRVRPEPETWSAIEYAAHSRDVTALHAFGVEQALTVDEPSFEPVGEDAMESASATYGDADPLDVGQELAAQAARLARLADDAGPGRWTRGLRIGSERRDVRRLLEHALHDSMHHLDDVERGLAGLRR